MQKEIVLSVAHLNVKFDSHVVLDDISFDVEKDSTIAVIGPNGAGKTVLFKAILGLIPYSGKVSWLPNVKIGYVPQRFNVTKDFPLTVHEFLRFKEKDPKRIYSSLEAVGFRGEVYNYKKILKKMLGTLSGGELQRVLIAFGILGDPQVLLFDEPTSGIDISGEETIYSFIHRLKKEKNLTIIFISHELQIVYKYADIVLCLNKEKVCFGPPREVIDKENLQKLYGEDVRFHLHQDHIDYHEH